MVPSPGLVWLKMALAAAALTSVFPAAAGAAERKSFMAADAGRTTISFRVPGVNRQVVRRGRLYVGRRHRVLGASRIRRALRRHTLKLKVSRSLARTARRQLRARRSRAGHRRALPRLVLTLQGTNKQANLTKAGTPAAGSGQVADRLAGFESGDFSELDNSGVSATSNTTESVTSERAYEGSKALKVVYNGVLGNSFGRVWYGNEGSKSLNWQKGTDVWYGAAFLVPDPARLRWTDLIRWDNYGVYADPEQGGLLVEEGKLAVKRQNYDGSNYAKLVGGPAIPANRWFWVEVHQRFSNVNGEALTELYLDGQKVGSSTTANSRGRTISTARYGYVYNWDAGGPSTLYTDRVSTSTGQRGPGA